MITGRFLLSLLLFCTLTNTHAAENFRFGILPSVSLYKVSDPLGPTDPHAGLAPAAVMLMDIGRDSRMMVQVAYDRFTINGSTTNVNNEVTSLNVGASYQMMLRLSRSWRPWLGIGAAYANEKYSNRYTLTPGGFLCASCPYPDRQEENFLVVLNASSEWQFNQSWDMGLNLQIEQPVTADGMRVIRFGVYAVY